MEETMEEIKSGLEKIRAGQVIGCVCSLDFDHQIVDVPGGCGCECSCNGPSGTVDNATANFGIAIIYQPN
jgi:hypothetical protein